MYKLLTEVGSEKDIHTILKEYEFETNYKKLQNANGVDILALKDGHSYSLEHKKARYNKTTGAYKIEGDVNGDILLITTPKNRSFFALTNNLSITKLCRFIDSI